MKKDKQQIIDFAKLLYLEYDNNGKRVYSLRDIVKEIKQKFSKDITNPTVLNWARKFGWNILNEKIKQQSIEKASIEKQTIEEQIIDAESDKLAKDYKNAENLANAAYNVIMTAYQAKSLTAKDAMAMFKYAMDIKFRINDMPESKPESKIKQVFTIGNQEIEF